MRIATVLGAGAFGLLLAAAPTAAQQTAEDESAKVEQIAATSRPGKPVLKKVATVIRGLVALARRVRRPLRAPPPARPHIRPHARLKPGWLPAGARGRSTRDPKARGGSVPY